MDKTGEIINRYKRTSLEERADIRQLVKNSGMCDDPGYYGGRGATISDLDDEKLEKIYQGIESAYGKPAAQNFAQMVADIPVLSTTDFLLTLYQLRNNNWKWKKKLVISDSTYASNKGSAEATFLTVIAFPKKNDTEEIRNEFLQRHGIKLEELI